LGAPAGSLGGWAAMHPLVTSFDALHRLHTACSVLAEAQMGLRLADQVTKD
jgi:hypothetical protein